MECVKETCPGYLEVTLPGSPSRFQENIMILLMSCLQLKMHLQNLMSFLASFAVPRIEFPQMLFLGLVLCSF